MRILIVDDEPLARLRIRQLLAGVAELDIVGEASDAEEAIALIETLRPDLLLLDIEMPGAGGMSLAKQPGLPPIVFTTAHREFALDAFDVDAVDFVTKPIAKERLLAALEKARSRRVSEVLRELVLKKSDEPIRITARHHDAFDIFDARQISRFRAEDKYVLFVAGDREMLIEQSLAELESLLREHQFLRVHRSELINLRFVRRLVIEGRSCTLELEDGQVVRASRRSIPELKRRLGLSTRA